MSYTILIVDDEENFRLNAQDYFVQKGLEVLGVGTLAEAREQLKRGNCDIVLLDVSLPDGYGPTLLGETANSPVRPAVILITAHGDIEMAVDAMKNGAHDFMPKPVNLPLVLKSIERACEVVSMRRELLHLRNQQKNKEAFIIGKSPAMQKLIAFAQRAAQVDAPVLISGETGTGKEVLANFIHKSGRRANKPFIAINCAAIQSMLLESELFGYEAGAFTSADKRKHGLMEIAEGGILFLDEISSMPLDLQAKLLRAIDEKAFRRVGGTQLIKVDVQVLAASNRELMDMIKKGEFREDLYYRLNVVGLNLPPLRERKEDIPELLAFYLEQCNLQQGMNVIDITQRAMQTLVEYNWPGNIRELKNVVARAMIFCDGERIDVGDLSADVTKNCT